MFIKWGICVMNIRIVRVFIKLIMIVFGMNFMSFLILNMLKSNWIILVRMVVVSKY